jgi:4-diphosphocytidyl-2-C-methyl-D-erythritol kinase
MAGVSSSAPTVTVRVPAKINICLGVGPLRPDGFHGLQTIFHALELYDTVTAAPAEQISLSVSGPEGAGVPVDEHNLAWRAAAALRARVPNTDGGQADSTLRASSGVALQVAKSIPVAAGLAGGSADCAGALVACDMLWETNTHIDVTEHSGGLPRA